MLLTASLLLIAGAAKTFATTATSSGYAAQFSPSFPNINAPTGVVTSYDPTAYPITSTLDTTELSGWPTIWVTPPTTSAEVQAVINSINWDQVPDAPVRQHDSSGNWIWGNNAAEDEYCWWTYSNCVNPKVSYLPEDYYTCPHDGDWGLSYDDGPYSTGGSALDDEYAEPVLYNFLAQTNQKATLFYIGSHVVQYPAAVKRGLNDGHYLCAHTWSHPPMTTLSNAEVVSELYWSLKSIKAVTGVTPKCFRPPQGDVDDRVRAIAWQMGMRTVIWDHDTNDWNMPGPYGGTLSPNTVDSYFETWINTYTSGKDKSGLLVLEHELDHLTVNMSMFWMPKIQKVFNVIPALACNGVTQPYWEENFIYPLVNSRPAGTVTTITTTTTSATSSPSSTCVSGSKGKKLGNGFNGYCCSTSDDCWDTCISGKCNGPYNTQTTTTKSSTTTTTKTATTAKASTSVSCISGSKGKKLGNGKTGACCSTSDDCVETCRSGVCGL